MSILYEIATSPKYKHERQMLADNGAVIGNLLS